MLALGAAPQTDTGGKGGPLETRVVPPPPAKPEEIGKHFPQLEILECLGRGGMGVVYKARQPRLDRVVALKILAPEKEQEPRFAERFAREAKALARLNHPNIVTVHDFGEANGMFYLLMEYVDGATLRQLLQARKIAPEEALRIVPRICDALQFAHERGVVHRDIKPENVLLDKQGRVKIADFGIARIVGGMPLTPSLSPSDGKKVSGRTGEGKLTQDQVVGTPHYMAPEQVEEPQLVDHRADIYSLGVVFYEMLTGELPLGKFQPPSKIVPVDARLDEVVLHALEKEPDRRYQHASQVKCDVETIATTAAQPTSATPIDASSARAVKAARAVRAIIACFAVAIAAIALVATLLHKSRHRTQSPATTQVPAFGPVVHRVLEASGKNTRFHGLNLESGVFWSGPASLFANHDLMIRMFTDHCVDLVAVGKGGAEWELTGLQITLAPIPEHQWENTSRDELRRTLAAARMEQQDGWRIQSIRSDGNMPLTFAVRTGSDAIGVLQITGFTNNPAAVQLRYKLAERTQPPPLDAAVKGIRFVGGFVKTNSAGRVFRVSMVYDEDAQGRRVECLNRSDQFAEWLPAFRDIEELWLTGGQATDHAMRFVGRLHGLKRLLLWDANPLTDEGVSRLADLKQLESLHINRSHIGDAALAVLAGLPRLQSLSLQENQFTDQGLRSLASMTQLTNLWLGRAAVVTDQGLKSLSGLVNLQELELQQCRITDQGLRLLQSLKKLRHLVLNGTETTPEGRAQLKAAIPGLQIDPNP